MGGGRHRARRFGRPGGAHRAPGPGVGVRFAGLSLIGLAGGLVGAVAPIPGLPDPGPPGAQETAPPTAEEPAPFAENPSLARRVSEPTFSPRRFTLAGAGDILVHQPLTSQARVHGTASGAEYDYGPMFDQVRPVFAATDLSICHLEVPLSADNTGLGGYPLFAAPHELADAIAGAGFDACSTASNHSLDRGGAGVTATLDALDRAGVAHVGTARSAEEAREPRLYEVAGVTVGHVSATYGLNGLLLPPGEPWRVDLLETAHVTARADAARDAGAEFVVASLHWGQEYDAGPTDEQRAVADALLAEGAVDLILGHHAHVVQPVGRVGERLVVFGMGNFLSNQSAACCPAASQDGVIVRVQVSEDRDGTFAVTDATFVPTWVDRSTFTIVNVLSALDDPAVAGEQRSVLEQSLARTTERLTAEDAELAPAALAAPDG